MVCEKQILILALNQVVIWPKRQSSPPRWSGALISNRKPDPTFGGGHGTEYNSCLLLSHKPL